MIILIIQFYLFLQLHEIPNLNEDDPARQVAWLGSYERWLARAAFFTSVVVLPPISAGASWLQVLAHISGFGQPRSLLLFSLAVMSTGVSTALGVAIWFKQSRLNRTRQLVIL